MVSAQGLYFQHGIVRPISLFDGTPDGDRFGTPTGKRMYVTVRMNLRQGGQMLAVHFWIEDPLVYAQPWTSVATYPRAEKMGVERIYREG